jgi:hypothetical protein
MQVKVVSPSKRNAKKGMKIGMMTFKLLVARVVSPAPKIHTPARRNQKTLMKRRKTPKRIPTTTPTPFPLILDELEAPEVPEEDAHQRFDSPMSCSKRSTKSFTRIKAFQR